MKILLLDTMATAPQVLEVEEGLETWYRLIRCDLIDITMRDVAGRQFDIIADDEGLLKAGAKVTAIDGSGKPQLVGNLVFCHHDNEGGLTGLSDSDIAHLMKNIVVLTSTNPDKPDVWLAMRNVDFIR